MKAIQSSTFRAVCAIVVGCLIIVYREKTVQWLTIAIGLLFFISGIISCAVYYSLRKDEKETAGTLTENNGQAGMKHTFPIVGLGSIILGGILALMPSTFITGLMYILAAILILGAINQFVSLAITSKFYHVGILFWLFPSIILIIAITVICKPMETLSSTLFIIGWCMLLYGITECIYAIMMHKANKQKQALIDNASNASAKVNEEKADDKEKASQS